MFWIEKIMEEGKESREAERNDEVANMARPVLQIVDL